MKKLMMFLAAAGLMASASCTRDDSEMTGSGSEGIVTLSARLPQQLQTRSMGDGTTATKLTYAVYEAGAKTPLLTSESDGAPVVEFNNLQAQLTLRLTTGRSYDVLFWADAFGQKDAANPYKVDFEAQSVTVDYDAALSNDESRDAFFGTIQGMEVTSATSQEIVLTRPFAQINVGTDDLAVAAQSGLQTDALQTEMQLSNVPTSLNLMDGTTSGSANVTFAANAIPTEQLTVSGKTYDYLAMNYLLIGTDKTTTNIAFTFSDGATSDNRSFSNVPVQRNYRTNIVGSVLTQSVDFDIEIDPGFGEPDHNLSALLMAAENGGTVTLTEDLTFDQEITVAEGKTLTLNLNDKNITIDSDELYTGFNVDGDMVINGSGSISYKEGGILIVNKNGSLTINDGEFSSDVNCIQNYGGKVVINGGRFSVTQQVDGYWYLLNQLDSDPGTITVYGGEFVNYDPATGDPGRGGNFVAEGYSSILVNDNPNTWRVVKNHTISTETDLAEAMADIAQNGGEITIPASASLNLDGIEPFSIQQPTVITLDGTVENSTPWMITNDSQLTLRGTGSYTCPSGIVKNNGNLTVEGGTWGTTNNQGGTAFYNNSEDAVLTLKDVDLDAAFFAVAGTGTIQIEGGNIASTSSNKYGSWAYTIRAESNCRMTLKDVTVEGVQGGIAAVDKSHVVCDNVTVATRNSEPGRSDAFYALYAASEGIIEVLSGSYYSDRTPCALASNDDVPDYPLGGFILKGGRFSSQPRSADNQPWTPEEGYTYVETGDSVYPYEIVAE